MQAETKAGIWLVFWIILFVGFTSLDMYRERTVANHLIYKDQNALYRLRTITGEYISDTMALNFVNSEITHIEHGIILLSPSLTDIFLFVLGAFMFGYFCYYYGKVKGAINERHTHPRKTEISGRNKVLDTILDLSESEISEVSLIEQSGLDAIDVELALRELLVDGKIEKKGKLYKRVS